MRARENSWHQHRIRITSSAFAIISGMGPKQLVDPSEEIQRQQNTMLTSTDELSRRLVVDFCFAMVNSEWLTPSFVFG